MSVFPLSWNSCCYNKIGKIWMPLTWLGRTLKTDDFMEFELFFVFTATRDSLFCISPTLSLLGWLVLVDVLCHLFCPLLNLDRVVKNSLGAACVPPWKLVASSFATLRNALAWQLWTDLLMAPTYVTRLAPHESWDMRSIGIVIPIYRKWYPCLKRK